MTSGARRLCHSFWMPPLPFIPSLGRGRGPAAGQPQPPARRHRRAVQVEPRRHLRELGGVGGGLRAPRRRDRSLRRAPGDAGAGARAAGRGVRHVRGARPARLPRLVFPVAALRRGPARQRRQRAAAAGAAAVRAMETGRVLVQPGAARRSRTRPCAAGWRRSSRCGSTASPSTISTGSRSTSSIMPASG